MYLGLFSFNISLNRLKIFINRIIKLKLRTFLTPRKRFRNLLYNPQLRVIEIDGNRCPVLHNDPERILIRKSIFFLANLIFNFYWCKSS